MEIFEKFATNKYLFSSLIFLVSLILSYLTAFILERFVSKIASKTETQIDDKILRVSKKPLIFLIILGGTYISLNNLNLTEKAVVKKIFFVLLVLTFTIYSAKITSILIKAWLKFQAGFEKTPDIISKVVNIMIYLVAGLILLDHLGVKITPLIATLGIGGLAMGLALQPTLANLISGLHTMAERSVRIGDFIEIPAMNISGYVEDIGWRSIRIRTPFNQIVIIPNSKFSESVVVNYYLPNREVLVPVQVGVSYESDLEKVERVTIDVAKEIQQSAPGAVKNFEPFIRYQNFGDSNINFIVVLSVEERSYIFPVVHQFIKSLKKRFDLEKIEISWPIRKIYFASDLSKIEDIKKKLENDFVT
ncbi:MAG: mechanosensitive ion channel family protein [Candidatus Calescibacterium sp.]|nr:mechanosensitive ion channel family protein [Candidatus Calescibacterium sp.]MCX7734457.1 mechanosensitive ion channel family protein [bacterium]MDW8087760.1 mechanosensitive ion channel family protein [Candidatus Calescibacterium sp.]